MDLLAVLPQIEHYLGVDHTPLQLLVYQQTSMSSVLFTLH